MLGIASVIIDVATDQMGPHTEAAVVSCEAALGQGQCRLGSAEEEAEWTALVRWADGEYHVVQVELRKRAAGRVIELRELSFSALDNPRDRWASVGVLIAALVAAYEQSNEAEANSQPEADSPPPPPPPAPAPRQPEEWLRWRFDLGASLNSSLDEGNPQPGALARASLHFRPWPIFALTTVNYAQRVSGEPQVAWFSGALGFGVRLDQGWFALELRSEAVVERMFASARERTTGRTESGAELRLGPRIGVDALAEVYSKWHLFVGAQASVLRPEVVIEIADAEATRAPAAGWALVGGVRYAP